MHIAEFDFSLPDDLIAQRPAEPRDTSRLLILDRAAGRWRDERFHKLPEYLYAGDTLVVNNTQVFPARLVGRREESGGAIELFLVREVESHPTSPLWEVLARPGRRLRPGARVEFGGGRLRAELISERNDEGSRLVRFETNEEFDSLVDELGRTPLPPYIKRTADEEQTARDKKRYQTIFAKRRGAIAAPTAGLHLTPRVLEALEAKGVRVVEITLHVGYGTFAPVRAEELSNHSVAAERFQITEEAARIINERRANGGRTIATGTTVLRALESAAGEDGVLSATRGFETTDLTITPGYRFRVVDALVTNFHLPRSSLLVLAATFAGRELLLAAYAYAVQSQYRFYSYGDAMLIV